MFMRFLTALVVVTIHAQGQNIGLTRRQQNSTAASNPFALISPSTSLNWSSCHEDSDARAFGLINCARLLAPLDFANQSAGTVQLAILKLSGSGQNQSAEAVFFNPGGPGDDPVANVLSNVPMLRAQVGNDTDIIVVVPRGVGSTLPAITCDATDLAAYQRLWEIQDTLPGQSAFSTADSYAIGQSYGLDCALVTPDLTPYVGTIYAAYDMDFVRQAVGQEELWYLGHSYGTVLGGTYAALFPTRVGRMVLDGVLDFNDYYKPVKDPHVDIGDADLALDNFFNACQAAGPTACALWANETKETRMRFFKADQRILEEPLPVAGYGLLNWPLWRSGVYNALYRPAEGFPLIAGVAREILAGAAGPNVQAYMSIVQGAASSTDTYLSDPKNGLSNGPNAGTLISCADSGGDSKVPNTIELAAELARYEQVSAFFGGVSLQYVVICAGANLAAKARFLGTFANITTATPILFVGNTADPTTPIRNAHSMAGAFPGSRVLTIKGTGHISHNAVRDSHCATQWIAPYFRNGTLPPIGTVCDGLQALFASSGD